MRDFAKTIEDVALRLPSLPKIPRKNFFDILDIQHKETLNSKILAFFLDPNEDHAYHELFKNALLAVLESNNTKVEQAFYEPVISVVTEEKTSYVKEEENRLKSIDIVLEGNKWCIVIENKIHHLLNNPLDIYHEHAQAKNKSLICIVLSLDLLVDKPGAGFINITHQDLISEVRREIPFDTSIPEIDIFYLREYFKNIESHYYNLNNQPKMNDIVSALASNHKAVLDIEKKKKAAIDFIASEIPKVFEKFNYIPNETWYVHPEDENLAFWISDALTILQNNEVNICFEVWKDLKTKTSEDKIREEICISDLSSSLSHIRVTDKWDRYKLVTFNEKEFIKPNDNFANKLTKILQDVFFSENGIEAQAINKLDLGLKPAREC
jgi:hypothetical protein